MGKENKSYRIRTQVNADSVVNFSMNNTVNTFEILSLKIGQKSTYRLMGSNTGVVVGRVLANGGFGVPNVKVSIFIEYEDTDDIAKRILYHYTSTKDLDGNGIRYNLLPTEVDEACHQNIGTFPTKRFLLDNNNWIEIFDKYYKFTTRTNNSGDYMIYGVPVGNQTLHMDVDLSDIGVLSQKPRDLIYKGYDANMFENMTKFKVDTNIDSLAQVITQDQAIYVYPFWGDTTDSDLNASITRCDLNINYKFEPTCIFLGSVISDTGENSMTKKCVGAKNQGKMSEMITGEGRIEMIRKTANGQVEQFSVKGDNNINSDGVWCYQIPMNLDYIKTDEFGKMVMSDDPNTGLPTRARVRFRLSMYESPNDGAARKRARVLIPNNPHLIEEDYPNFCETKEVDYEFGTKTKNENFRDIFWNNVYTVKSYIPRLQKSRLPNNMRHLGIKMVNHSGSNNPMPFNNLRIKFNFVYMFLCTLSKVLVTIVNFINSHLTFIGYVFLKIGYMFFDLSKEINFEILGKYLFEGVARLFAKYNGHGCKDSDGLSANSYLKKVWEDKKNGTNVTGGLAQWFINLFLGIGCGVELKGLCETDEGVEINVTPGTYDRVKDELRRAGIETCNDRVDTLFNCIENQLAQDNEVTSFNFYNDWINGVVYLPLWYRKIKKKKDGSVKKDQWCSTDNTVLNTRKYKKNLRLYATNVIKRNVNPGTAKTMGTISPLVNNEETAKSVADNETGIEIIGFTKYNEDNCYGYNCHKYARSYFKIYKGIVFEKETILGEKVYYYKPCDYDQSTGNSELVTLFATDLVLLGSLNECDIHGVPQFFKALESTTYNMPPDLLSETYDYINEDNQTKVDDEDDEEIDLGSRMTEYTGADWGDLGVDQSNYNLNTLTFLGSTYSVNANENEYDNGGLFYGLTCFNSYTKPKSCINLSRICEFGVSLDESEDLASDGNGGTDENTDTLTPDGFISYDEIYNPDYRSMFATLNSNFLRTKLNPDTGMIEYDFNHIYVDNFDGSLKQLMMAKTVNGTTEKSDFQEKANYINNHNLEISSDAYLNFRYGNYVKRNGNKIYFYENNNVVGYALNESWKWLVGIPNNSIPIRITSNGKFPRYENSFYFYFGLNEGKTAIDKFNNEFFSDCANKFAADVPYDLSYRGNSWCPMDATDGYIAFSMNIDGPYTITFTNKDTNDVYYQTSINKDKILFSSNPDIDGYEKYTVYKLIKKGNDELATPIVVDIIPNGTYSIEVIDAYDNTYDDNLTFELPRIGFLCDVKPFSVRNNELLTRFKGDGDTIKDIYTNIANYGKFAGGEYNVEYSSYEENDIIKSGTTYYVKVGNEYLPTTDSSDKTVQSSDVGTLFYKHNPRVDRDINGYIGISEVTEYDFRIKFEPIDKLFFGENYKGECFDVHIEFERLAVGTSIGYGEVYYIYTTDGYVKVVNKVQALVVTADDNYYKAVIMVDTGNYFLYSVGDKISDGDSYFVKDYAKYAVGDIIYAGDQYYKVINGRLEIGIPFTDNHQVLIGENYYHTSIGEYAEVENNSGSVINVGNDDNFYYEVDGCGYLGEFTFNGVTNFFIGVPYGNERYKLTLTQLCNSNGLWLESNNVTTINIVVYEDEFKLYINDIDYDIISKFVGGWTDSKLNGNQFEDGEGYTSAYISNTLYGWNDVLNIGSYYKNGILTPIGKIQYSTKNTRAGINSDMTEMLSLCDSLSSSYTGNASSVGSTPYCWNGDYVYDIPKPNSEDYFIGTVSKITYTYEIPYRFLIKDGVILYDYYGNIVEAEDMVYDENIKYYKDDEHQTEAIGHEFDNNYNNYDYTWMNWLYGIGGVKVYDIDVVRNTKYYIDSACTIEAILGENYIDNANSVLVSDIMRVNYQLNYKPFNLTDYLFTGDVYYVLEWNQYVSYVVVDGYENGISVRDYSNIEHGGNVLYYSLDTPEYAAEYFDTNENPQIVVATETNDGNITYVSYGNTEYTDLDCLNLIDYIEIVNNINTTIDNRSEFVRNVAAAFRINDGETSLALTTKTKAKPVKYLIVGSEEKTKSELLFTYTPSQQNNNIVLTPIRLNNISEVRDTEYVSLTDDIVVCDGYVADKNLETPNISFQLPTLTVNQYVKYKNNELLMDGDVYYVIENGVYTPKTVSIKATVSALPGQEKGVFIYGSAENTNRYMRYKDGLYVTDYYIYENNTYEHVENTPVITNSTNHVCYYKTPVTPYYKKDNIFLDEYTSMAATASIEDGDVIYYLKYGVYVEHTATVTKSVAEYKQMMSSTDTFYKNASNSVIRFQPYTKYGNTKHPYYISVVNNNACIIPPGKDLSNFEDLTEKKNLDTTFGVHFYNKPLSSDIKTVFAYINGTPAYPKVSLGGNDILGTLYNMNYFEYDVNVLDDNTTLSPGTSVIGCNGTYLTRYTISSQSQSNYTVSDLKNESHADTIYNDFIKKVNTSDYPNITLYSGDVIFTINTTPGPQPDGIVGNGNESGTPSNIQNYTFKTLVKNVVKNKTRLYDYINSATTSSETYDYYLPTCLSTDETRHTIEFVRSNSQEGVKYFYYGCESKTISKEFDLNIGTYRENDSIPFVVHYGTIPSGWDYYEKEMINDNEFTFKLHVSDGNKPALGDDTVYYYYYNPRGWYAKRSYDSEDFIYNNDFYVESGEILSGDEYYPTPIKVRGIPSDMIQVKLGNIGNYYGYWIFTLYPVGTVLDTQPPLLVFTFNGYGYKSFSLDGAITVGPDNAFYYTKNEYRNYDNSTLILVNSEEAYNLYKKINEVYIQQNITENITVTPLNPYYYKVYYPYYTGDHVKNGETYYTKSSSGEYLGHTVSGETTYEITANDEYYSGDLFVYYGSVTDEAEYSATWKPINVSMPGFMTGYLLNGTPREGDGCGENIKDDISANDKSNIVATIEGNELVLYTTPNTQFGNHPDVYENNRVERLMVTNYMPNENARYGEYQLIPNNTYLYQYVEVPLSDTDLVYTDGYGVEYRYPIKGTSMVMFDTPNINHINEGRTLAKVENKYDDYLKYRTFYINDDGYTRHQSAYYLFDMSNTEYPLYYYYDEEQPESPINSNLRYENNEYYFNEMPELFKHMIDGTIENMCINESKSTKFNLSNYLREKYGQTEEMSGDEIPPMIRYPRDKFFVVGLCDGNYSISPVIETQTIRLVYNYEGFNNSEGSPIYITSPYARVYSTEKDLYYLYKNGDILKKGNIYYTKTSSNTYQRHEADSDRTVGAGNLYYYRVRPIYSGLHYVEDYYYLMNYRFTVHVAMYDMEKGEHEDDMFTQVYSRAEGSAELCYIKVIDMDSSYAHPETYWATALKINMSSLGREAQTHEEGKINPWLHIMIEDKSYCIRKVSGHTSGTYGVYVTEFNTYEEMLYDYNLNFNPNDNSNN